MCQVAIDRQTSCGWCGEDRCPIFQQLEALAKKNKPILPFTEQIPHRLNHIRDQVAKGQWRNAAAWALELSLMCRANHLAASKGTKQ